MSSPVIIAGTAMAVLVGVVLVFGSWFSSLDLLSKIVLFFFGLGLCGAGILFSRG